ncbi:tetratricopeptide repeat protein [Polaribacter sargassicola]|uniref:tetratricopeptide repeat protein n=1 Tax=Polaribacter sargassicola TaxID=2836891 RepID=UPI001F310B3C|nr:tetratricopeptide repeat protein [Polaribacter sp. DS7-9]MCG1035053.1 tetratricopeptide repeat protein [Polaribacter sp. DS7-9]
MKKLFLLISLTITSISFCQNEYYLAEDYYREGEYEKATQLFKNLYSKNPFNTTYLSRLISCYQETNTFNKVEEILNAALDKNPDQTFFYVYLGYNYQKQQLPKLAEKNYTKALNSIDKNSYYGGFIGRLFKDYNLLDNAILAYKKTMAKNEKADYNFRIAQIYGEKGELKKMFESYLDLVEINIENYNLVKRFTSSYITDDAENEANILFRKALLTKSASNPKDEWNILLSWLFTLQKDYNKAFVQEKALYVRNPLSLNTIFDLGKIAFENKDYNTAKECFNFINKEETLPSEKIESSLYLAKIAVATNNPETEKLFTSFFNQFGKNTSTIKLQVEYADFLTFKKDNPNKAKAVLEEALELAISKFDKARIKLKLGDILVFTGKYNKALIYFSQIQTQLKNHELAQQARFKVARTSYFKGDFTWAKAQLKVLKSSTTQLIANDALELYLTITDNEPVDSIPSGLTQYAKAELLAYQNKTQQAINTLNIVHKNFKGQPIEDESLFKQAKLFIELKQYKAAISNLEKIILLNSNGILIDDTYFELAELYNNYLNNPEKASEYYQKIIFDYPSSIFLVDARKKYRKIRGDTNQF